MNPRRHGKGTLKGLLYDPWRKLAALALAILLWVFLDRQITDTVTLECILRTHDSKEVMPERTGRSYLYVSIPKRDYSEDVFHNPNDVSIDSVSLTFEGPSHVIDSIEDGEQFLVRAQPRRGETMFEFDTSMIEGDSRFLTILKSMDPVRVIAVFKRNKTQDLNLSYENFTATLPPTNGENYAERLQLKDAVFTPPTVTLVATEKTLNSLDLSSALYHADLKDASKWKGNEIRAQLTLLDKWQGEIVDTGAITVTIPLKPNYEDVAVKVRVLLDLGNTNFRPTDFKPVPSEKVMLQVSGQLKNHLGNSQQEKQAWARENLFVYAPLPKGATLDNVPVIMGQLMFVSEEGFELGKDYLVEAIPVTLIPAGK